MRVRVSRLLELHVPLGGVKDQQTILTNGVRGEHGKLSKDML